MFWDFCTTREESVHQIMYLFGERGIPDGFRHMNGYGSNTFKMVNANDEAFYVKFHIKVIFILFTILKINSANYFLKKIPYSEFKKN